jgi:hypothetical protein
MEWTMGEGARWSRSKLHPDHFTPPSNSPPQCCPLLDQGGRLCGDLPARITLRGKARCRARSPWPCHCDQCTLSGP